MGWRKIAIISPVLFIMAVFALLVTPDNKVSAQGGGTFTPTPFYCPATSTPTSIIPSPAGLETMSIPTADFGSQVPTSVFATLFVQTAVPTNTPPAGTSTPNVTATATQPPTNDIFMWGGCVTGNICTEIAPNSWHIVLNTSTKDGQASWYQKIGTTFSTAGTFYVLFHHLPNTITAQNAGYMVQPPYSSFVGDTYGAGSTTAVSWITFGDTPDSGNPASNTAYYTGAGFEKWTTFSFYKAAGTSNTDIGFLDNRLFNGVVDLNRQGQEFWVSFYPLYAPTTIPPSPTPGVGCVVNTSTNITSDIIEWSAATVTMGECYTIIPEVMLTLPELSWSPFVLPAEVGIPGLFVCVDTLSATLKFLSFDVIALISGIVTVICGVIIYKQINS